MKNIVWIDVGTHFAQEHSSVFGSSLGFYAFLCKRFVGGKLLGRGKFVSFHELKNIINYRKLIRQGSSNFFTVIIEANPKIARKKKFYPQADIFFNLALTDDHDSSVSIAKLYIGKGGELSEGNSLFHQKDNTKDGNHFATFGVSSSDFFDQISLYLDEKFRDYDVLLRLNCEGVEDSVIYSAHKSFGSKLKLVCGSLKDVKELKGDEADKKLNKFLHDQDLSFVLFSSGIDTWHQAYYSIFKLLDSEGRV